MKQNIKLGQMVIISKIDTPSHIRTPSYLFGKSGVVVAALGSFRNPERMAYGGDGLPKLLLYRVSFRQTDLWPDYDGPLHDTAVVEIYETWLEAAF